MLPLATSETSLGYQPALDGLRAVFVLAVLCFHGGYAWARGGFLGVSGFFTLSGFLITALLLDEQARTGTIDLVDFWRRRARRLLPAAWLAIAVAVAYGVSAGSATVARHLPGDVLAAMAYVANWRLVVAERSYEDLFAEPSPVTHLWSLAIEEQVYLVFPLLLLAVLALARGRLTALAIVLGVGALLSTYWMASLHHPAADTARVYYGTDTRVAEFLIGGLGALFWRWYRRDIRPLLVPYVDDGAQRASLIAGILILVAWTTFDVSEAFLYQGGFAIHAVLVAVVVLTAVQPGPVRTVLSIEPLRRLGLISYGVYLYHWPIFLWLTPARTGRDGLSLFGLRLVVTLGAAMASYVLVERPIRRGDVALRRPVLGAAGLAAVVVVAIPFLAPVPAVSTPTGRIGEQLEVDELADLVDLDAPEGAPRVAVFGDSTAVAVFKGLGSVDREGDELAVRQGHIRLGCGLVERDAVRVVGQVFHVTEQCAGLAEEWRAVLEGVDTDVAVVLFGPWEVSDHLLPGSTQWSAIGEPETDEAARVAIRDALELLLARTDLVVWLTSPPIDRALDPTAPAGDDPAGDPARMDRWNELVGEVAAEFPPDRVAVVDLAGWFDLLPGGPLDPAVRPDGVHVADDHAPALGRFVADELLARWREVQPAAG
jgi:peptidoglycan/LPS O-acetylase OafA/YrhL